MRGDAFAGTGLPLVAFMLVTGTLLTVAELAERLRLTEDQLREMRRRYGWPCVRFSRKSIRFTEEQAAEIVARHSTASRSGPLPVAPGIAGQTEASRRRWA